MAKQERRSVSIFINGREVANNLKAIRAEKRKVQRELALMTRGTVEYEAKVKELRRLNGILDEHRKEIRNVGSTWDKMKGNVTAFAGVAAAAFTADALVQYSKDLFRAAMQMELLGKKAKTVFGETYPIATKAAQEHAAAMGLTESQYIDAAAAIQDILIPMGFQRQEATNLSLQLTNLSGALSEWTGGQISAKEVTEILGAALTGERERLKQLGIVIQEADVKARLAEKGLENLTGEMLQQAKAAATLELIMEKSTDAQAAFASNADTMARRQAELAARFETFREQLATALIPVFERLLTFAEMLTRGFSSMQASLANLLDPARGAVEAFQDQQAEVASLESELVPLLDRYDELSSKSDLSASEQDELRKIIQRVGEIVPTAITQFDEYGRALGISAERAREFVEVQRAMLEVKNAEVIQEQQQALAKLRQEYETLRATIEGTGDGFTDIVRKGDEFFRKVVKGGKVARVELQRMSEEEVGALYDLLGQLQRQIEGTEALIKQLSGQPLLEGEGDAKPAGDTPVERITGTSDKDLKKIQKQLDKLRDIIRKHRDELALQDLDEEQVAIERVRQRYAKEIELAKELEAQGVQEAAQRRIELEELMQQEITRIRMHYAEQRVQEDLAREAAAQEELTLQTLQYEQDRIEAERTIREALEEEMMDERDKALKALEDKYNNLLMLAQQYGIDTTEIERMRREQISQINREYDKKDLEQARKAAIERAQVQAQTFNMLGGMFQGFLQAAEEAGLEHTALNRALALAQIASKSAEAIANATASASELPFPANLIAIGTAVATVLSNIAQAKRLLEAQPVPQRKEGGWMSVRGVDDGMTYRAQYIGSPDSGMLPNRPVVLASERGPEYFVSARDLRNPLVLDHVRAIEAIRMSRSVVVPQFAQGGPTAPLPTDNAAIAATLSQLTQVLSVLSRQLQGPITAVLEDDVIMRTFERSDKLRNAAGD